MLFFILASNSLLLTITAIVLNGGELRSSSLNSFGCALNSAVLEIDWNPNRDSEEYNS